MSIIDIFLIKYISCTTDAPQILEHITQSLTFTPFDVK